MRKSHTDHENIEKGRLPKGSRLHFLLYKDTLTWKTIEKMVVVHDEKKEINVII